MITADKLSFSYGSTPFIESLGCTVGDGSLTVLLGPNGSGKSTLLRLCAGLIRPHAGSVLLDGTDISSLSPRDMARRLAFMPQSRPVPAITVRSLAASGRFPYTGVTGRLSPTDREAIDEALELTGMTGMACRELRTLSGGERQKAYLAMLIAQGSKHLLLDEPTTYLDIGHRLELMELLTSLKNTGRCVLAVLHDIDLASEFADRAIVLSHGSMIHEGAASSIVESGAIQRAYSAEPIPNAGLRFRRI